MPDHVKNWIESDETMPSLFVKGDGNHVFYAGHEDVFCRPDNPCALDKAMAKREFIYIFRKLWERGKDMDIDLGWWFDSFYNAYVDLPKFKNKSLYELPDGDELLERLKDVVRYSSDGKHKKFLDRIPAHVYSRALEEFLDLQGGERLSDREYFEEVSLFYEYADGDCYDTLTFDDHACGHVEIILTYPDSYLKKIGLKRDDLAKVMEEDKARIIEALTRHEDKEEEAA